MGNTASKVLQIANNELGYLEKASASNLDDKTANAGKANYTKYWRDLCPSFQGQAWCNCFVNWCFAQAYGATEAKKMLYSNSGWSYYTPTSSDYFKKNNAWTTTPKEGYIIYFKNSTRIHHVGIVTEVSNGRVFTIEGNTSKGTAVIPNGGGVYAKDYSLTDSSIAGYGIPKYDNTAKQVIDIPIGVGRAGLKIVGTGKLNVRKSPDDGTVVTTYRQNQLVQATAKAKGNEVYWFKTADGYISGKYVEGWIKESNKWWYVEKGYTYPSNIVKKIDNNYYAFDKDGWMITSDRIKSDGSITV